MKRIVVTIGLLVGITAAAAWAETPAAKPGPEHQKLQVFVGDWTSEGETKASPLGPAGKVAGKFSVRPVLGGFFIEFRGEETIGAATSQWIEIDGYDPSSKRYRWTSFGSDGSTATITYTLADTNMKYEGTMVMGGKEAKVRGTVVFDADFMGFLEKREFSLDGEKWSPQFESRATKKKAAL